MDLVVVRTGEVLVTAVEVAVDSASRKKGLLGRTGLAERAGLIIAPTNAVHTFFMRFPIDIVWVTRQGVVLKVRESVPARRVSGALRAYAVVELAGGAARKGDLTVGDRLELRATRIAPVAE